MGSKEDDKKEKYERKVAELEERIREAQEKVDYLIEASRLEYEVDDARSEIHKAEQELFNVHYFYEHRHEGNIDTDALGGCVLWVGGMVALIVVLAMLSKGCDGPSGNQNITPFTPTPYSPDDSYDRDPRRDGGY